MGHEEIEEVTLVVWDMWRIRRVIEVELAVGCTHEGGLCFKIEDAKGKLYSSK